jgi:hypothetical protein
MAQENQTPQVDELTTADGRKVLSFAAAGESYAVESTEQAAKGKTAETQAEIEEIKLNALRRGIRHIRL